MVLSRSIITRWALFNAWIMFIWAMGYSTLAASPSSVSAVTFWRKMSPVEIAGIDSLRDIKEGEYFHARRTS